MSEGSPVAGLNGAQLVALLLYVPLVGWLMRRVVTSAVRRGWPLPLTLLAAVFLAFSLGLIGATVLVLALRE